jgi:hypothetical protein
MLENNASMILCRRAKLLYDSVAWIHSFKHSDLKRLIIEWIQNDQLKAEGVDADDKIIGYYSSLTAQINPKKKFNTHYTLEDTGELFRSMFVRVLTTEVIISANTDKIEDQEWYRSRIFNLNDENLRKFVEKLKDEYIRYARKVLLNS